MQVINLTNCMWALQLGAGLVYHCSCSRAAVWIHYTLASLVQPGSTRGNRSTNDKTGDGSVSIIPWIVAFPAQ